MLELGTGGAPLPILVVDIDGLVHETHTIVSSLMLEGVAVLLAELHDLLDDLGSSPRNLDRVGLDVRNVEALLLDEVLEVYHKERASLSNNIVHVPRVLERIGKLRRSETIHGVDDDLECEGQGLVVDAFLQEGGQSPIEQCSGSCIIMVLDGYSGLLDLAETLSVSVSEEVETLD